MFQYNPSFYIQLSKLLSSDEVSNLNFSEKFLYPKCIVYFLLAL